MKEMKILLIFILCIVCMSCYHKSDLKSEGGVVIEKQYFPDTNQDVSGTGFTSDGKVIFTSHHIGADEKFMVIFKCDHGVVFSVNRSDIYATLNKGDEVRIQYYEYLNSDNEVKGLKFENATKR